MRASLGPDTETRLVALSLRSVAFGVTEHQEDSMIPTSGYSSLTSPHDSQEVPSAPLGGVLKELSG